MRARLAESAFELFGERGIDAVTLDEVAAHCGVTKGSFYSHYASKREVILAACSHYYRAYQERVQAELAPLTDPAARLRRVVALSVRTCILDDRNRVFTTEVFALALRDAEARQGWAQFYDSVREMYVGLVLAVQAARGWDGSGARAAVDLMLAAMEGIKMRAALEPHLCHAEEQRSVVDGLLRFLIPEPPT